MSDSVSKNSLLIFGLKFSEQLCSTFASSNETRRLFILGTITLISTASVRINLILYADRLATLGSGAETVAASGLFADASRLRCFHCDAVVTIAASATDAEHWAAHKAASPACYLAKLGLLVINSPLAPDTAELQVDARRYQPVLRRLRQLLDSSIIDAAVAYGFDANFLRMCAGRHFMRNGCAVVERPGDLIRLVQESESTLPPPPLHIDLLRMLDGALPGIAEPAAPPPPPPQPTLPPPPPLLQPASTMVAADGMSIETAPGEADDRCVQCRSRTRNRVTLPCAHFLLCDRCLDSLSRCPKCSQTIIATITAFIT